MDMMGKAKEGQLKPTDTYTKAIKGGKAGLSRYHIKNNSVSSNFDTTWN